MRTVRLVDKKTGETVNANFRADEVTEQNRRSLSKEFNFACKNTVCTAQFYYRGDIRPRGNDAELAKTFVVKTSHIPGCPNRSTEPPVPRAVYRDDGFLHARLNFPIGGAPEDRHPSTKTREFLAARRADAGKVKIKKTPVVSMRALSDLMETRFGTLETHAPHSDFEYKGKQYAWGDIFIPSDRYDWLYQKTYGGTPQNPQDPLLVIVRPVREIEPNEQGKQRFMCEGQYVRDGKMDFTVRPVLVCEPAVAQYMDTLIARGETLMVASKQHPSQHYLRQHDASMVYLSLYHVSQLARVDGQKYWRFAHSARHQLQLAV